MQKRTAVRLVLGLALGAGLALGVNSLAAHQQVGLVAADRQAAEFISSYTWERNEPWFGGFSGIDVSQDGLRMLVLSDRATLASVKVTRQKGDISAIDLLEVNKLRSSKGNLLRGRIMDSEGLAVAPDGALFISFEGVSRVVTHRHGSSRAKVLPRPKSFRKLPLNKALEALAVDSQGHLFTLPERALNENGDIPVWRWNGQRWDTPFTLPSRGGFLPVGADIGPDGRFYLLERDFKLIGFRSRLRRWDLTDNGPSGETNLLQTGLGTHDNLEGLSVWRNARGELRATLISDDNFGALQRTELVEYRLPQ